LLGVAVALAFIGMMRSAPMPVVHRWIILLSLIVMLPASRAAPAPTESWVTAVALYLSGHDKPFQRGEWLCHSE
jgi:hypothetical protein